MKNVQVLMSTYNGGEYLKEQIDSIISQIGVEVHILVRDDGSKDETLEILKQYKNIEIIEAQNVGATRSFLELITIAGDYDFYAFADQDDIWDTDKLEIAVEALEQFRVPAIYSGNTRLVDGNLNFIKDETLKPITTLGSALVKNYVTGCTAVFNSDLMKYLKMYSPIHVPFHDWWVNLVCLSIGGVSIYDSEPHMNYRQHGNNVVSGNESAWKKWISRLKKVNKPYHRDLMAQEIINAYKVYISPRDMEILNAMMNRSYVNAMSTGSQIDNILFRFCLCINRF